jgi:Rrf2 family protein
MMVRRDRGMMAVLIMLDVAFHAGRGAVVPAGDIAERLGEARRGIEPVLQALSRAGLLGSTRGPKGGYRLGRAARDIRLAEVAAAVRPGAGEDEAAGTVSALAAAVVLPLWEELEASLMQALEQLTLADLLRRAAAKGLQRPTPEALNFAI